MQVPYLALRYPVLEVGLYPAVGQALPLGFAVGDECVVCKTAIVCVIVCYFYSTLVGGAFKSVLRHHHFFAGEAFLQVDKGVT